MRRPPTRLFHSSIRRNAAQETSQLAKPPLIQIKDGTFYRHHPNSLPPAGHDAPPNPALFPNLTFTLPSFSSPTQHWSILSASSSARTTFLQALRGQHLCFPPTARSYPYLSTPEIGTKDSRLRFPAHAIQYVGFDAERSGLGGTSIRGAYLASRYESRHEVDDWTVMQYLKGETELNAPEQEELLHRPRGELLERVIGDLRLEKLVDMPVGNLSNGQTRRARIAKALLGAPEVLLLDGPFMGLDPPTLRHLSSLLHQLAEAQAPRLILSLKPDDVIPDWTTHLMFLDANYNTVAQGPRAEVFEQISDMYHDVIFKSRNAFRQLQQKSELNPLWLSIREIGRHLKDRGYLPEPDMNSRKYRHASNISTASDSDPEQLSKDGFSIFDTGNAPILGNPVVEMSGVQIRYGDKCVLGDWHTPSHSPGLHWTVRHGQRWGIFGPNGSGKTTLLSLLTSDHPQSYSIPMKLFGRSRLPQRGKPGLTLWDISARLGHSSPEVHTFFPRHLTLRRALESAWADTPLSPPKLTHEADLKVDAVLRWDFEDQDIHVGMGLEWAEETRFGEVPFSAQRVLLFLRAIIRNPELLILDEAFSGMDESARDRCLLFLSYGERKTYRFLDPNASAERVGMSAMPAAGEAKVVDSDISRLDRVRVEGLKSDQAILVVSHNPAEVPGCVREWICLPEAGMGEARFGRLEGPLGVGGVEGEKRWKGIWGV
ncbi:P-loop containing nucleoside triphosphate hydrolase protein [Rhizodiscina lignyota]|uniref:P-loop containing nucleoside triphosphate hydrolase protein n=1 Tax=Rhizodiscina lignyota TaxID=1504668 RepID=A0A9P4IL80_9PEZI|nr:P-loop containing nucleoside triphosphate hydrolase protein [Rhizodiscina lignyota]